MDDLAIVFAATTAILGITNAVTGIAAYRLNSRNRQERKAREEAP